MKSFRWFTCLAGALLALGLTLARAQTAPEAPSAPDIAPAQPSSEGLRSLDAAPPAEPPSPADPSDPADPDPEPEAETIERRANSESGIFVMGSDAILSGGETAREVVAIIGNTIVDGIVDDEVVAIMGDSTLNGEAREVVAVMGNVTVNGHVRGDVVAVMGGVQLGPRARVDGEVVSIGGGVERAPGSTVGRGIQEVGFMKGHMPQMDGLRAWLKHCLLLGRPLGFGEHLGWAWGIAFSFFAFYVLLALAFGKGVEKCAETLEQRPGYTILAAFLTMLAIPILTVLLAVTGVGPVVLFFAGIFGTLFGKAAFITWMGRRFTKPLGIQMPVLAALIGGLLLMLFYVIPYLGIVMWKVSGALGLGMVVYTLILGMKREKAAAAVAAAPVGMAAASPAAGFTPMPSQEAGASSSGFTVEPSFVAPPPLRQTTQMSTLPRAGFWIRIAASALDAVLVGICGGIFSFVGNYFLAVYTIYCIAFWALKGTTIGGVICGLKVVRLDDRKLDWTIAVVRALGGFLSFVIAGLGFIWVAFDADKQSWHDKIAGTTVVRVPKGTPLI
ncbi:MAG TPA: RDD family protein [Opitutaceae bacterium]